MNTTTGSVTRATNTVVHPRPTDTRVVARPNGRNAVSGDGGDGGGADQGSAPTTNNEGRSIGRRSVSQEQVRAALVAVADLFEAIPELHCQDYLAKDGSGIPVHPLDPAAEHWCLFGAMFAALAIRDPYGPDATAIRLLLDQAAQGLYGSRAADANNHRGRIAAVRTLRAGTALAVD